MTPAPPAAVIREVAVLGMAGREAAPWTLTAAGRRSEKLSIPEATSEATLIVRDWGGAGGTPGSGGTNSAGGRGGAGGVMGTGGSGTWTCGARGDSCANQVCCSGFDLCSLSNQTCIKACGLQGDSCSSSFPPCCTSVAECDYTTGICGPPHISDRNAKKDFSPADPDAILEGLSRLPISTWAYKTDESQARHIGPMAQDFMATFHVGASDKTIFQIDGDGVAFAAIQSLNEQLKRLRQENADLRREVAKIRAEMPRTARVTRGVVRRTEVKE